MRESRVSSAKEVEKGEERRGAGVKLRAHSSRPSSNPPLAPSSPTSFDRPTVGQGGGLPLAHTLGSIERICLEERGPIDWMRAAWVRWGQCGLGVSARGQGLDRFNSTQTDPRGVLLLASSYVHRVQARQRLSRVVFGTNLVRSRCMVDEIRSTLAPACLLAGPSRGLWEGVCMASRSAQSRPPTIKLIRMGDRGRGPAARAHTHIDG